MVEETVPAHNRVERGKRITKEQESSNSKLFSLLTEVREKMKRKYEQHKEELRWSENNQAIEDKKIEDSLVALQQRDEEMKEELTKGVTTLRA